MIIHRINWGIYMRNKNNMHRGFTLAEMMIVMLILTIIYIDDKDKIEHQKA